MTRSEAGRLNGALSHGPITPEGKLRSAGNATKHGLNSSEVVMPGEDPAEFQELLDSVVEFYFPKTAHEQDLIMEIAASRWRLRRLIAMEQAVIETEIERAREAQQDGDNDPAAIRRKALVAAAESRAMQQIHRYENRLRRAAEKAEKQFIIIRNNRLDLEIGMRRQIEAELAAAEEAVRQGRGPVEVRIPASMISEFSVLRTSGSDGELGTVLREPAESPGVITHDPHGRRAAAA